jgi:hypothetical protein
MAGCKITLPSPGPQYNRDNEAATRHALQTAFLTCTGGGGGVGLSSRHTVTLVVEGVANGDTVTTDVDMGSSYVMPVSVESDTACWLRLYATDEEQTDDLLRDDGSDPDAGKGVLGDFIWITAHQKIVSPATGWFNADDPVTTSLYATVRNDSGATADITLTFVVLSIEA